MRYDQWKTNEDVKFLMKKNQLENYGDVQLHFTNNISDYINSVLGKRMMGWNEIMGNNLHNWGNNDDNATTKLSKNEYIDLIKKIYVQVFLQGFKFSNAISVRFSAFREET